MSTAGAFYLQIPGILPPTRSTQKQINSLQRTSVEREQGQQRKASTEKLVQESVKIYIGKRQNDDWESEALALDNYGKACG